MDTPTKPSPISYFIAGGNMYIAPAPSPRPCTEYGRGAHLESFHEWEHASNGNRAESSPLVCTRCGCLWEEFDLRARAHQDIYIESFGDR